MSEVSKNNLYDSQIGFAVSWFSRWNELEQADAMVKMFTSISPIQAKFLTFILNDRVKEAINAKIQTLEDEANNADIIKKLIDQDRIDFEKLMVYLPLLREDNIETKSVYTTFLPFVFSRCIESSAEIKLAEKLLNIVLIHPALKDSRNDFELFRNHFSNVCAARITDSAAKVEPPVPQYQPIPSSQDDDEPFKKQVFYIESILDENPKRRDSISSQSSSISINPKQSRPTAPGPASPPATPIVVQSPKPGMKDLYNWLKFLRLHKYYNHFVGLTYEELLSLDDENFDDIVPGVTKGARKKFLLTIDALRQRYDTLVSIEREVMSFSTDSLIRVMDQMKLMIFTPLKETPGHQRKREGDVPDQFYNVLIAIFSRLVQNNMREVECVKRLKTLFYLTSKNAAFRQYQAVLNSLKSRLYVNNPHLRLNASTYLRPVVGQMPSQSISAAASSAAPSVGNPCASIPVSTQQQRATAATDFELINHPHYNSQEFSIEDSEEIKRPRFLPVGSGLRSVQGSSEGPKSIQRSYSLGNANIPSTDGAFSSVHQRTRGQSWNGESNEYRLFDEIESVVNTFDKKSWRISDPFEF